MEDKMVKNGPYIAINSNFYLDDRVFNGDSNRSFFIFLFRKALESIPEHNCDSKSVVVRTNKDEWEKYIQKLKRNGNKRTYIPTMDGIETFLKTLEKEKLATVEWNNDSLEIVFSSNVMYYGED